MRYLLFVAIGLVTVISFVAIFHLMNGSYPSYLMPHGSCYYWQPEILYSSILGNGLIAISSFVISAFIVAFVKAKKVESGDGKLYWLFASLVFLCGGWHLVNISTIWSDNHGLESVVALVVGGLSVVTVSALSLNFDRLKSAPTVEDVRKQFEIAELHRLSSLDAVVVHEHGVIREANERTFEMFNMTKEQVTNKAPLSSLVAAKDIKRVGKYIEEGRQEPYGLEITPYGKDQPIYTIVSARQIEHNGRTVRVTVIRDVTETVKLKARVEELEGRAKTQQSIRDIKAEILKKLSQNNG